MVVLGTYRLEDGSDRLREWLVQLDRERNVQEVKLTPLTRHEVGAMLQAIFGQQRRVPSDLVDALYTLAEGNPFFTEELLKSLLESGLLAYADGVWDWDRRPVTEWQIPRSLQSIVQQRVAQLDHPARDVVELAAVIGRRFDFELLRAVAQVDERTLLAMIKELISAQLVVEESRDQFAFRHALTREAIYTDLLARERAALHRAVAEAAERVHAASLEACLDDLAYHYFEGGVRDRALSFARQAGERAQGLYAPRAAVEQYSRALESAQYLAERAPPGDSSVSGSALAAMHCQRGRAYATLGDFTRAQTDYLAAADHAQSVGDRRAEWSALLDLGLLWTGRDYTQAGAYFDRALEFARGLNEPALIAQSLNRIGNWLVNTAQPRQALPLHGEALGIFENLGDRGGIANTLDLLGTASYLGADLQAAIAYYERAASLFRELDDRPGLSSTLAMLVGRGGSYELGRLRSDEADFARSVRDGELALQIARDIDWREGEACALFQLTGILGFHGHYARALESAQRSRQIAEEIQHRQWITAAHCGIGELYVDLLMLPAARQHLEHTLTLARDIGSTFWTEVATGWLAWVCALQRDVARAQALLGSPPDVGAPIASLGQWWVAFGQIQLALARDEPMLALRLLNEMSPPMPDGIGTRDTPYLALTRAEALLASAMWTKAEAVLVDLCTAAGCHGLRPVLWRCHTLLGELLRRANRAEEAQRQFSTARGVLEELASPLPEELRLEYLREATTRLPRAYRLSPSRVATARHQGLTGREREVVALIARGMSNREIATALVLGERTVETHVANILAKLGLGSRREVAAWASARGLTAENV
jgi:DNA-binding CsgD family transcriptional regulator